MMLMYSNAVKAFMRGKNVALGGGISVAAGPFGRLLLFYFVRTIFLMSVLLPCDPRNVLQLFQTFQGMFLFRPTVL